MDDEDPGLDLGGQAVASGCEGLDVGNRDVSGGEIVDLDADDPDDFRAEPRAIEQVQQREGNVGGMHRQSGRRLPEDFLGALRVRRPCTEFSQGAEAAFAENAPGLFADDAEDSADATALDADRIVRDVKKRLFEEPLPAEKEEVVLRPKRFTRPDHALEQRSDDVPHLAPAIARRTTECPRMLRAKHRRIGVVVDRDELGTPEENDLRLRRQQDADRAPEALRPRLHGTERRRRPVVGPHLVPLLPERKQQNQPVAVIAKRQQAPVHGWGCRGATGLF